MSLPPPLALTPCLPTELLSYILQQAHPTALIICGSRTSFLSYLLEATSLPPPQPQTPKDPDPDPNPASSQPTSPSHSPPSPEETDPSSTPPQPQPQPQPQQPPPRHPLLTSTLHQVSLSRHTITAFIPTVSHLRAYLSVFSGPSMRRHVYTGYDISSTVTQSPLLVVYGLVELHRDTSEWSTQGLGNTCAALVEAGRRSRRRVVLVEERRGGDGEEAAEGGGEDVDDDGNKGEEEEDDGLGAERTGRYVRERGGKGIWHEKLPILSGSVRRAGAEIEYGGRTVEVGVVLRRWFKFGRREWDDDG